MGFGSEFTCSLSAVGSGKPRETARWPSIESGRMRRSKTKHRKRAFGDGEGEGDGKEGKEKEHGGGGGKNTRKGRRKI